MAPDPAASPGAGVFLLDTGYLVALEDADDDNHSAAREHREGLRRMPVLTTTSYVLDEAVTLFNVRGRHGKAVELGEMLLSSRSVRMVHVGEVLLRRGLEICSEARRPALLPDRSLFLRPALRAGGLREGATLRIWRMGTR